MCAERENGRGNERKNGWGKKDMVFEMGKKLKAKKRGAVGKEGKRKEKR